MRGICPLPHPLEISTIFIGPENTAAQPSPSRAGALAAWRGTGILLVWSQLRISSGREFCYPMDGPPFISRIRSSATAQ